MAILTMIRPRRMHRRISRGPPLQPLDGAKNEGGHSCDLLTPFYFDFTTTMWGFDGAAETDPLASVDGASAADVESGGAGLGFGAVDGDALPPGKNRRRIALYVAVGLLSPCWLCGVPLLALQIMYVALFHLGRVSAARATLRWSHVLFLVDAGCGCAVMLCAAAFLIGALVYSWTDAAVNGL